MELQIRNKIEETDVLIAGGGISGLQAAIAAGNSGVNVIVAEKAHAKRSGNGTMGNDHFMCWIPKIHGEDLDFVMNEIKDTMDGPWQDDIMLRKLLERSEEMVEKWQSYGINMKPTGEYHFEGHTIPGHQHYHLKFDGRNQKKSLYEQALKVGAVIHNHVVITELLTDDNDCIIGAIGISIKEDIPELIIYKAKAVIIATGPNARAFPPSVPAYMFNICDCPACTGGVAMGYRVGAKLVNYDILGCHAGPKYFERSGKATWIGALSDSEGKSVSPFVNKPSREYGDPMSDIWPGVFSDKLKNGTAPVYMNCTELSEEDLEYMKYCFETEGIGSVTDYLEQHKIDLRKSMIEFGSYSIRFNFAGLEGNTKAETNVKGLYGAGVAIGNVRGHITQAAVFGEIAGENAAEYAKNVKFADEEIIRNHKTIKDKKELYKKLLERKNGSNWKEVNAVLQQIMKDYVASEKRSATLLQAGKKYIRDLREASINEIKCENSHELLRTMEVFDLMDVCELGALCADNRKESRGPKHDRPDYPFINPLLNGCLQTVQKQNGKVVINFRKSI